MIFSNTIKQQSTQGTLHCLMKEKKTKNNKSEFEKHEKRERESST